MLKTKPNNNTKQQSLKSRRKKKKKTRGLSLTKNVTMEGKEVTFATPDTSSISFRCSLEQRFLIDGEIEPYRG